MNISRYYPRRYSALSSVIISGASISEPPSEQAKRVDLRRPRRPVVFYSRRPGRRGGSAGNGLRLANQWELAGRIGYRTAGDSGTGVVTGPHIETIGRLLDKYVFPVVIELSEQHGLLIRRNG